MRVLAFFCFVVLLGCDTEMIHQADKILALEVPHIDKVVEHHPETSFQRDQSRDILLDTQEELTRDFTIVDDTIFLYKKNSNLIYAFGLDGSFKYNVEIPEDVKLRISGRLWNYSFDGFIPHEEYLIIYLNTWEGVSHDDVYTEVFFRKEDNRFSYFKHIDHSYIITENAYETNQDFRLFIVGEAFYCDGLLYVQYPHGLLKYHPDAIEIDLHPERSAYRQPFWHEKSKTLYTIDGSYQAPLRLVAFVRTGQK